MIEPAARDLTLYHGGNFDVTLVLYADPRVTQWRGTWQEFFVYEAGEAVELEPGEVWVATARTMSAKPGGPSSEEFWSPLERLDLAGQTVELVCEGVFTLAEGHGLTVEPTLGTINVSVAPSQFAAAPGSAHYYVKVSQGATVTYPINGTMLFKQP